MSVWEGVKSAIRVVAPAVASILGTPLAGSAVSALCEIFLGKSDGTADELEAAISVATPEKLLALKQLNIEYAKLELQEMQSARTMYSRTIDVIGHPDTINLLVVVWSCLMYSSVTFLGQYINDASEKYILEFLGQILGMICAFYFGKRMDKS